MRVKDKVHNKPLSHNMTLHNRQYSFEKKTVELASCYIISCPLFTEHTECMNRDDLLKKYSDDLSIHVCCSTRHCHSDIYYKEPGCDSTLQNWWSGSHYGSLSVTATLATVSTQSGRLMSSKHGSSAECCCLRLTLLFKRQYENGE